MNDDKLIQHIIEIKQALTGLEAHYSTMKDDLKEHRIESLAMRAEVNLIKQDIDRAKGSIRTLQFLWSGVIVVVPGLVYTITKFIV